MYKLPPDTLNRTLVGKRTSVEINSDILAIVSELSVPRGVDSIGVSIDLGEDAPLEMIVVKGITAHEEQDDVSVEVEYTAAGVTITERTIVETEDDGYHLKLTISPDFTSAVLEDYDIVVEDRLDPVDILQGESFDDYSVKCAKRLAAPLMAGNVVNVVFKSMVEGGVNEWVPTLCPDYYSLVEWDDECFYYAHLKDALGKAYPGLVIGDSTNATYLKQNKDLVLPLWAAPLGKVKPFEECNDVISWGNLTWVTMEKYEPELDRALMERWLTAIGNFKL